MIVAGVDVGNSTTELACARLEPGGAPQWLCVLRAATTGAKGSAESAAGVRDLLARAARRAGEPVHTVLLAQIEPVETALVELGRLEELDLARNAVARPASSTPSGEGAGAGRLRRLEALAGPPDGPAIAVVLDEDFDEAAAALRAARERGWQVAGVVVRGDDAVLIGNRFDRALPIIDELDDAASLPQGALAAVEVAAAGATVTALSDPLRLAALLDLGPQEARAARHAARAVAGERAAVVVREASAPAGADAPGADATVQIVRADGTTATLEPWTPLESPGAVVALRGAAGSHEDVLDAFWCALPEPHSDPAFRRRLVRRRALALALLARRGAADLHAALAGVAAGGVVVVCEEWRAAVLGASTTPRAGSAPFVADLGGGTVDLHRDGRAIACAGAGELVTAICAALLDADRETAERAKRVRAARVETPFVLHHEDGSRSFLGAPAPPHALARLCALTPDGPVPLGAALAPEVWRDLRRTAKRQVVARNVRRAIEATGGVPRGELVMLVGGCACDSEVVDEVAAELSDLDVAVARGDVLGRHGPRAAVAVGLVLAHAASMGPG